MLVRLEDRRVISEYLDALIGRVLDGTFDINVAKESIRTAMVRLASGDTDGSFTDMRTTIAGEGE